MKKVILLAFLLITSDLVFAQKTDTIKRRVDDAVMLSTDDIITNAARSSQLNQFVNLVKASGLDSLLTSNGPFTVFAPTNKAFDKAGLYITDTLLKPANKQELKTFLSYYVVAGKLTSKDILKKIKLNNGQAVLTTYSGGKLIVSLDVNRNIVLTDDNGAQAIISKFDIQQKNGILDLITDVLRPKKGQP